MPMNPPLQLGQTDEPHSPDHLCLGGFRGEIAFLVVNDMMTVARLRANDTTDVAAQLANVLDAEWLVADLRHRDVLLQCAAEMLTRTIEDFVAHRKIRDRAHLRSVRFTRKQREIVERTRERLAGMASVSGLESVKRARALIEPELKLN